MTDLGLIAAAPLPVKLHLATVLPAFALGTWQMFLSRKGSPVHRAIGVLYLSLMVLTSIAAFFIHALQPGHFSLVHLLIPLTLYGVFAALWYARRGNIAGHRRAMILVYAGALLVAGGMALSPGRLLYRCFFG